MEKKITLDEAREWYNGDNITLKKLALKAFTKEELEFSFKDIKTFKDACNVLNLDYDDMVKTIANIIKTSEASAAMFELNIIRKALNLGQNLNFTESFHIYYPYILFVDEISFYCRKALNSNRIQLIGKIKNKEKEYCVLGGNVNYSNPNIYSSNNALFLGCATKEIAQHFGRYFGMLIVAAKHGDLPDFKIIDSVNDLI